MSAPIELAARAALLIAVAAPLTSLGLLSAATLASRPLPERRAYQLMSYTFGVSLFGVLAAWLTSWLGGRSELTLGLGSIVSTSGYTLDLSMKVDRLSFTLLTLDFALCGLIGVMSGRYLHREEGAHRFALLINLLAVSVAIVASAAGLDVLFVGWELLGVSSTLLISFFHRRTSPVEHGLRAFTVYRITDVGLLAAVVTAHHALHGASFDAINSSAAALPLALPLLVVWGAMGKGAMAPFTGWLPRAMEGPTPSSAVFYGALSIHASPFLLMRLAPTLSAHPAALWAVGCIGAVTAVHAATTERAQGDIKSALGYSSVSQVGLMWVEVALGLHTLVLLHMVGHATLRTWQIVRSPSLLQERARLMLISGEDLGARPAHREARLPARWEGALYRLSLERWHFDDALRALWLKITRALEKLDALDRALARRLGGGGEGK